MHIFKTLKKESPVQYIAERKAPEIYTEFTSRLTKSFAHGLAVDSHEFLQSPPSSFNSPPGDAKLWPEHTNFNEFSELIDYVHSTNNLISISDLNLPNSVPEKKNAGY